MQPKARVIGVDPGPTPGFCVIWENPLETPWVFQTNHEAAVDLLEDLSTARPLGNFPQILAIEKFVVGRRAARSATAQAGEITRSLIAKLEAASLRLPVDEVLKRPATQVKAWATDKRLEAAGLARLTKGMPHARDAARHALYTAVADGFHPDPLSKKAREK